MKTEQEARKCWCPFARVVVAEAAHASFNRVLSAKDGNDGMKLGGSRCIASECMAWRQGPFADILGKETRDPITGISEFEEPGPPQGYCGLAGKP